MYIEKVLDLLVQLMKNGGKNKSVAFIILFSVYICTYTDQNFKPNTFVFAPTYHKLKLMKNKSDAFVIFGSVLYYFMYVLYTHVHTHTQYAYIVYTCQNIVPISSKNSV